MPSREVRLRLAPVLDPGKRISGTVRRNARKVGVAGPGRLRPPPRQAFSAPWAQWPNRSAGANIPFSSKWERASSTERKIRVAVSVMNGLGFLRGFHTT